MKTSRKLTQTARPIRLAGISVSAEERATIQQLASERGLAVADYVRRRALGQK